MEIGRNNMSDRSIAGVVLAGGKSSRYGKPKMFESYKGKYFYEHSVDALKANFLSPIIIATNNHLMPYFKRDDVHYISEPLEHAYQGPLYAISHVMDKIPEVDWFFVLSCDIPFVTPDFVKKLIDYTHDKTLDAIVPKHDKRMQPLLALYHRRCLKKMKTLVESGNFKIKALFDEIRMITIPFASDDKVFVNINNKNDWHNWVSGGPRIR